MQYWTGKSAVIVGGSTGLGRSLAESLCRASVGSLALVARDSERLQQARDQLAAQWPQVNLVTIAADLSTSQGAATLRDAAVTFGQPVDLLLNAVGLSDRGLLTKLTPERMDQLLRANLHAPLSATQAVLPQLHRGSVIVNIGSLSSYFAPPFLGGYSIAKHALRGLTQQLRMELASEGIHVMLVCPGPIARSDTGQRYSHLESAADLPPEALQSGGGAKLKGLDPARLSVEILRAASTRQLELVRPWKARLLMIVMALSPNWGESILRRKMAGRRP